ncbi:MAG TPA: capsular biosynthesis protein [Stellaceae bacterium]|jgi:capsular polysaccharide export protein|nr:capsular biosynthesis protein [Stellaceae bacterium]
MDSRKVIAEIAPHASSRRALRMRRFRHTVKMQRPAAGGGIAVLFPECAGLPGVRLMPGLLRAAPRGPVPPVAISGMISATPDTLLPGGVTTPDRLLAAPGWERPELLLEAQTCRRAMAAARVGGTWWQSGGDALLPAYDNLAVVALDETAARGDSEAMLASALAENPADRVVVLTDGAVGQDAVSGVAGVTVIDRPFDPWLLLDRAARVYSAGGETGFLALTAGIPVSAFAASFYTGWGVTNDAAGVSQHAIRRSVDEIFAACCLIATRYRDPFHDTPTNFAEALGILAEWRRIEGANRRIGVCVGMSFWKRRRIAEFVRSSSGTPVFRRDTAGALAAAQHGAETPPRAIAGWASRLPPGLDEAAAEQHVPLIRVEDGFIRSVGLGSDFMPPASLVFDSRGMYFDPRVRSDLEILLRETDFTPALIDRAQRLAVQLVARGVTKYNLSGRGPALDMPTGSRRILVPGQVEDDLSIRFGGSEVSTNVALLEAVRAANPDAFIIYKPHPDVVAGHRKGAVAEPEARRFADMVLREGSTASLLAMVDELHTMTSLAGFEALLRGRSVTVYGRPFYAGWGLTIDKAPLDRGRRLALAELIAGVLILYPRYLDPLTGLPCGPEVIVERLDHPELWRPGPLILARRLQGIAAARLARLRRLFVTADSGSLRHARERLPD